MALSPVSLKNVLSRSGEAHVQLRRDDRAQPRPPDGRATLRVRADSHLRVGAECTG